LWGRVMQTQILRSEIDDWRVAVAQLRFPDYLPASGELSEATANHNGRVKTFQDRLNASYDTVETAMAAADGGAYGDLVTALEQSRLDRGTAIQELATLWTNRIALAEQAYAEFSKAVPPADEA